MNPDRRTVDPPGPLAAALPGAGGAGRGPIRSAKAVLALGLGLIFLVLGLGLWTYAQVRDSLRETHATGLQTLRDAEAEALRAWIEERKADAVQWAANAQSGLPAGTAYRVLASDGTILAADLPAEVGGRAPPAFLARLAPAFAGEPVFLASGPDGRAADDPGRGARVWFAAPVRAGQGRVRAVLALARPAEGRFSKILRTARSGETGEAYVFDASGRLLTESRFAGAPVSPDAAGGGDGAAQPTPLVARAIAAHGDAAAPRHGLLLDPYRSYPGHEVIGAWRWLPEYDIGLALEIGADEAYAPLRFFHQGLLVLMAPLALGWLALFLPAGAWRRLALGERGKQRIGPYLIERRIGEGGLSNIYLARHRMLIRPVALKVLKTHAASDEMIARFAREVQAASQLTHPATIEIYDYGRTRDGVFYCAMQHLEGLSVADLVERHGALPASRTAYLLRQVCGSLAEAHARGLIHRDVKPQNIMVCEMGGRRDVVKLLDFGLVKNLGDGATRDLTRNLRILGTPLYMSPERISDPARVDARADIYALGAVAFLMLTGRRLFEADNDDDLVRQVLHVAPPRVASCAHLPAELAEIVDRCLAKDPAQRPASVTEFEAACEAVLAREPWTRRQIECWWDEYRRADAGRGAAA